MRKLPLILLTFFPIVCAAQAYKCDVDGRKVFTDKPCKGGVEVKLVSTPTYTESSGKMTKEKMQQVNNAASRRIINDDIDRKQDQINLLRAQYERLNSDLKNRMPSGNSDRSIAMRNSLTNELTTVGQEYDRKLKDLESELARLKEKRDSIKDN